MVFFKKNNFIKSILVIAIAGLMAESVQARDELWKNLNTEILRLSRQGKYDDAVLVSKNAVKVAEKNYGATHPHVATSLNNLATLYRIIGRYDDAEKYYSQSLTIREKALGPNHPSVATSLNNLAGLYRAQGRLTDAEPLYIRHCKSEKLPWGLTTPIPVNH